MDNVLHMGKSLARIAIEQAHLCSPGQRQVELPGEIRCVSHSGAHSLTGERWHEMSRVTREEEAPIMPAIGPARLKGVDGVAFERGILRGDVPGSEQLPHRL